MLKQIKYFQSVVRNQNFTEAAEECFISQSAISQQIQAFEKELGVKLIEREKQKFVVTPAGEYFFKKAWHLWQTLNNYAKKQNSWRRQSRRNSALAI